MKKPLNVFLSLLLILGSFANTAEARDRSEDLRELFTYVKKYGEVDFPCGDKRYTIWFTARRSYKVTFSVQQPEDEEPIIDIELRTGTFYYHVRIRSFQEEAALARCETEKTWRPQWEWKQSEVKHSDTVLKVMAIAIEDGVKFIRSKANKR